MTTGNAASRKVQFRLYTPTSSTVVRVAVETRKGVTVDGGLIYIEFKGDRIYRFQGQDARGMAELMVRNGLFGESVGRGLKAVLNKGSGEAMDAGGAQLWQYLVDRGFSLFDKSVAVMEPVAITAADVAAIQRHAENRAGTWFV